MLEEYEPEVQVLKNGKVIEVRRMLVHTNNRYKETRQLYNLRYNKRRNLIVKQVDRARTNTRTPKYTLDEARWIVANKGDAIAKKYNCSVSKAYSIKHYVRAVYGI